MIPIDPVLLALAGAGLPFDRPLEHDGWGERLDDVFGHGLAGLLAWAYASGLVDLDEDTAHRLQLRLESEAIRAVQLEGELIRLERLLAVLPAVVLKGAVLAHGAYPDPVLRPFTDLDLLVAGRNLGAAIDALDLMGYARTRPEPAPGYDSRVGKALTLTHPGGVVIDLHRTLVAGVFGDAIDVGELLATRRPIALGGAVGGVQIPGPAWEAHLVETALHAVVGDGLARAISIRDIAQVALHPELDPARAADLARRWKVSEPVADALRATVDGLGLELPEPLATLMDDDHSSAESLPAPVRSARSRLTELRHGDVRRRLTLTRALVAPSPAFLRWAYGDHPAPELYGRRWLTLYRRALEARSDPTAEPAAAPPSNGPDSDVAPTVTNGGTHRPRSEDPPGPDGASTVVEDRPPPAGPRFVTLARRPPVTTVSLAKPTEPDPRVAGTIPRSRPRQARWSDARPRRPNGAGTANGPGKGAKNETGNGNGNGSRAANGAGNRAKADGVATVPGSGAAGGDGPPTNGSPTSGEPDDPRRGVIEPVSPAVLLAPTGGRYFCGGMGLLFITVIAVQLGVIALGTVLVPAAAVLFALAASRRIARRRPEEAWVGRWLVAGVVVKVSASYFRYLTLVVGYQGDGDASQYDEFARRFVAAWTNGTPVPVMNDVRKTNFIRWFTGAVYYVFGSNMLLGFFVFGLLALVGAYLWYRATADALPTLDKRLYLGLVLFAPSIAFWPSAIGKEALMQLGIGAMALATSFLLRQKLMSAILIGLPGGYLLWVVRPHLFALVTIATGCAYLAGRVRSRGPDVKFLLGRSLGLIVVAFLLVFSISQGMEFLGLKDLSLTSVETSLEEQTATTSQGGSQFDTGGDYLSPVNLPRGFVTVLVRPFPWETTSPFQLLASLESALLTLLIIARLSSVRESLVRARARPFLLYAWVLTVGYAATFASFANFGLLVRQRSLVLPALFVLIAIKPAVERSRGDPLQPDARPDALPRTSATH